MQTKTLINGELGETVSVQDRGLHYGDGLFETIAVESGKPLLLQQHLQRLRRGGQRLGIEIDDAVLTMEAEQLATGIDKGVIKILLTRGVSGRGYAFKATQPITRIVMLTPWPDMSSHYHDVGISLCKCQTVLNQQPALAGIKHLNRLEQVLARNEWSELYQEGVMCDQDGNVIEGTMSNIFIVNHGELLTPMLDRCGVNGIMRQVVIECARDQGIPLKEDRFGLDSLESANGVFVTNSLIGVWPVKIFVDINYNENDLIKTIQQNIQHAYPKP